MSHVVLRAALMAVAFSVPWSGGLRPTFAQQAGRGNASATSDDALSSADAQPEPVQACPAGGAGAGSGATTTRKSGPPLPLFYNFYVGPPGVPAQIYPGPRPTPEFVGQVWVTYPPLMPHEFLYHHTRRHYRYTPSGYSSASIRYSSGIMGFVPAF